MGSGDRRQDTKDRRWETETGDRDRRQKTGDWRWKKRDGRQQETGKGRQETVDIPSRQGTGDKRQETGDGRQETGIRRQEMVL